MIRGLYHSGEHSERFCTIEDIAAVCRVAPDKVRQWFSLRTGRIRARMDDRIELAELLYFLVDHNMPVPASLLPQNTGKILFIVAGDDHEKGLVVAHFCRIFLELYAYILVQTVPLSRATNLTVLTFRPDTVTLICTGAWRPEAFDGVAGALTSLPGTRTVVFADEPAVDEPYCSAFRGKLSFFGKDELVSPQVTERMRALLTR